MQATMSNQIFLRAGARKKIYGSILETIGHTPLIRLNKVPAGLNSEVLAKVEGFNPGGSVKDRIGITMIKDAEERGLLKRGDTIVEPTSGNTGIGLAMVAALRGYKMVFVIPDKMSQDKINILRAYGAEVIITPTAVPPDSPESYYSVAKRIAQERGAFMPGQYFNPKNPEAHYKTTGPEIWEQTDGRLEAFVAGMGTGGTISGVGRFLKEKNAKIKVIGVDPEGSILKHYFETGQLGEAYRYEVEGIGEDFIPGTTDFKVIDAIYKVTDQEAFVMARRLAREEGLLVGGSGGAAVHVALQVAKEFKKGSRIVVLIPDRGDRYLTKFYSDEWMRKHGYLKEEGVVNTVESQKV